MVKRPFRFGGGLFRAESHAAWADGARRLEAAGYDTALIGDHFSSTFFAPVPALLAAALATTRLRVGCTVFANDFRHPATLAKDLATGDVLSGGRFEFGFGTGYNKAEYDRVGIAFDSPAVRFSRFQEAVQVLKGLWADGPLTFKGEHYSFAEYDSQPKPLQRPHPPMLIGGGGRRLLSLAAREANSVGILPRSQSAGTGLDRSEETDACVAQKIDLLRQAAPDRFDELELALLIWAVDVTDNRQAGAERIASRTGRTADQVLESPYFLIGTVDAIVERLIEQRERHGISYISVFEVDTTAFAPVVARLAGR